VVEGGRVTGDHLRDVSSYVDANEYLRKHYWKNHNRRYARPAAGVIITGKLPRSNN
jgi:hypothetical protein